MTWTFHHREMKNKFLLFLTFSILTTTSQAQNIEKNVSGLKNIAEGIYEVLRGNAIKYGVPSQRSYFWPKVVFLRENNTVKRVPIDSLNNFNELEYDISVSFDSIGLYVPSQKYSGLIFIEKISEKRAKRIKDNILKNKR